MEQGRRVELLAAGIQLERFSASLRLGGERPQEVQNTRPIPDVGSWVSEVQKFKEFLSPSYVSGPELGLEAEMQRN